jgi:hypothetical protein
MVVGELMEAAMKRVFSTMKRIFSSFAAIVLVSAMSAAAMAQSNTTPTGAPAVVPGAPNIPYSAPGAVPPGLEVPSNSGRIGRFDRAYLDKHPDVAQQLKQNPNLINDQQFLASHPDLSQYLNKHPGVRTDFQQNPSNFMNAEGSYNHFESGQTAVGRFDKGYLDKHPEVAQQLARHPELANDPNYLAQHPELKSYLASHGQVRTDLQQHPDSFMDREHQYQRVENNGNWRHPHRGWRAKHGW